MTSRDAPANRSRADPGLHRTLHAASTALLNAVLAADRTADAKADWERKERLWQLSRPVPLVASGLQFCKCCLGRGN